MVISEWRIGKDMENCGHGLICGTILAFSWSNWGISRNTSIRIVSVPPDLQAEHLLNISQKHCHLSHLVQYANVTSIAHESTVVLATFSTTEDNICHRVTTSFLLYICCHSCFALLRTADNLVVKLYMGIYTCVCVIKSLFTKITYIWTKYKTAHCFVNLILVPSVVFFLICTANLSHKRFRNNPQLFSKIQHLFC
jgi:hypothetical protein